MSIEINIGYFFPDLAEYVHKNYPPADSTKVDDLIAKKQKLKEYFDKYEKEKSFWGFDPLTSLRNDLHDLSTTSGMSNIFLETLAAVQKCEAELPDSERELTPKKYLELLVCAELTVAHNRSNHWIVPDYKEVRVHTERATKLLEFLKYFES